MAENISNRTGRSRGGEPSIYGKVYGDLDSRTRALEKRVDGEWTYIGTYPGDDNTTPDSPPFQGNWENVGDGKLPLRYRWTLSGKVEIEGVITGGTVGDVIFTLPERLWPDEEYKVPFYASDSTPATLCVETDGDVIFCALAGAGAAGDPLATVLGFGGMIGWWRLGESYDSSVGSDDDAGLYQDFPFVNSAYPSAPAGSLLIKENLGGPPGHHYYMRTNGDGPEVIGDWDDGALLMLQGAPALTADLNPSNSYSRTQPYSYAFWFAPGIRTVAAGVSPPNNADGLVLGTSFQMDGSGSYNVGEGFLWNPYAASLRYAHWGSSGIAERTTLYYPLQSIKQYQPAGYNPNSLSDPSDQWWEDHGFRDEVGPAGSVFTDPYVYLYTESSDNWWHIGLTFDGYTLRGYLNGTLFASAVSLVDDSTSLLGSTLRVGRTEMDLGVSSYWQGGDFAADELMMWNKCLSHTQMATVYRLGQSSSTSGISPTSAANVVNAVSTALTGDTVIQTGETFILCDTSGGGFTITLPSATSMQGIAIVVKKKTGSNTLTIEGQGSETIDGSLNTTLTTAWSSLTLISDGTQWLSIA